MMGLDTQACTNCNRVLPLHPGYFQPHKMGANGFERRCKECRGRKFNPDKFSSPRPKPQPGNRICTRCKSELPETTEHFRQANSHGKLRFNSRCNTCLAAIQHEKYHANPEKYREASIRSQRKHADRVKAYQEQWDAAHPDYYREYRVKNREKRAAYNHQYEIDHKDALRERRRKYREAHPEVMRRAGRKYDETHAEKRREFRESHKDLFRQWQREWAKAHPEHGRAKHQRRRALKRAAGGKHTAADIRLLLRTQKRLCWWCGTKLVASNYHVDHRIPLARGGSNAPENLCIACPECNLAKSDKLPHEFNGRLL